MTVLNTFSPIHSVSSRPAANACNRAKQTMPVCQKTLKMSDQHSRIFNSNETKCPRLVAVAAVGTRGDWQNETTLGGRDDQRTLICGGRTIAHRASARIIIANYTYSMIMRGREIALFPVMRSGKAQATSKRVGILWHICISMNSYGRLPLHRWSISASGSFSCWYFRRRKKLIFTCSDNWRLDYINQSCTMLRVLLSQVSDSKLLLSDYLSLAIVNHVCFVSDWSSSTGPILCKLILD